MADIESTIYSCTVFSSNLPADALAQASVAVGVVMNNYFKSAHMPLAVKANEDTIFGKSWDITQRVDHWDALKNPAHAL